MNTSKVKLLPLLTEETGANRVSNLPKITVNKWKG